MDQGLYLEDPYSFLIDLKILWSCISSPSEKGQWEKRSVLIFLEKGCLLVSEMSRAPKFVYAEWHLSRSIRNGLVVSTPWKSRLKSFVHKAHFRKQRKEKHVSVGSTKKPPPEPAAVSASSPSQLPARGGAGSRTGWITAWCAPLQKGRRPPLPFPLTFHHSLTISVEYSPNWERWGRCGKGWHSRD